jgi:hypothetical protein
MKEFFVADLATAIADFFLNVASTIANFFIDLVNGLF